MRHDEKVGIAVAAQSWYVLVTSEDGGGVFAVLGPFATPERAERSARDARVVRYRVELAPTPPPVLVAR